MGKEWDVEKYRNPFEPDEQWELKKKFLQANKDLLPKDRALCLAQVLVNMEFLGARYNPTVEETINELSQSILEDFRDRHKNKLQRTFVGGGAAASAKINRKGPSKSIINLDVVDSDGPANFALIMLKEEKELLSFRKILDQSARYCNTRYEINSWPVDDAKTSWTSVSLIDRKVIAKSLGTNKKHSEKLVNEATFTRLAKTHHQIIINDSSAKSVLQFLGYQEEFWHPEGKKRKIEELSLESLEETKKPKKTSDSEDISASQKNSPKREVSSAMKMMMAMGWKEGSGLGAQGQGIVEPISQDVVVSREGIGYNDSSSDGKNFKTFIRQYLKDYMTNQCSHRIIFSTDFTKEQRAIIHNVCRTMGLHSRACGTSNDRQLSVFRYNIKFDRPVLKFLARLKESEPTDPIFEKVTIITPGSKEAEPTEPIPEKVTIITPEKTLTDQPSKSKKKKRKKKKPS